MAYADGELAEAAYREFEARFHREPELKREVDELKALELLVCRFLSPEARAPSMRPDPPN